MANTEDITRGLTLEVYRNAHHGDCTNGGITSCATRLILVGVLDCTECTTGFVYPAPKPMRVFNTSDEAPAVALEIRRHSFGTGARALATYGNFVPVHWDTTAERYVRTHSWTMFGGNFASTSDSRLPEYAETQRGYRCYIFKVHDRIEN